MAIIDLVRWSPQGDRTVYAHRFPETNLSTYTQLIVQESQEAILFLKGQLAGKFGPGKHTLNTENLPILRNLFGIPFGGKNPFTAEIWFVNKLHPFNIDWQTDSMPIHDADYNTHLPLVAKGRYGLKIKDSERFLVTIVGTKSNFTQYDLTDQFFGEFSTRTKSTILQFMLKHNIGLKSVSAHLSDLSDHLKGIMQPFWDQMGLEFTQFYITSIDIDTSNETGIRVKEAIAQQSAMSITSRTWQQEELFKTANNLSGENGGLIGGLMAMQMMGSHSGPGMMQPQYGQPAFGNTNQNNPVQPSSVQGREIREVYCSGCSKKFSSSHKFCPHCGDPYTPCQACGTDNDKEAKRCVSCGTNLRNTADAVCEKCNTPLPSGSAFCGNCGVQAISEDHCSRCSMALLPGIKFCPKCGNKR